MLGTWGKIFQVLPERPSIASAFMITPKFSMQAFFDYNLSNAAMFCTLLRSWRGWGMDSRQGSIDGEDPDSNLARDRAAYTHHNKAWERHHKTFLQRLQASYLVDDLIEQSGAAHAHAHAHTAAPRTPADREPKTRGGSLFSKAALHEDSLSSAFSSAVNIAALGLESPTAECDTVDELAPLGFCNAPLNGAHRSSFAPGLRSNSEGTPQFNAPKLSKLLRLSFTEAHNTSHPDVVNDSSSAFLGEEPS
eukprot:5004-Heterococcus_DN1.PRE.2